MGNRISFNQVNTGVLNRIFENYNRLEEIQVQLSTGKKLNKASDNPVDAANTMQLRSQVDRLNSYIRNVEDGQAYLGTVEITFRTGNSLYQNMRERGIQAANDSLTAQSRVFIGQEVRGMFDQMVGLSNTSFKGEYIFSGSNTQAPPYELRTGSARVLSSATLASGNMQLTAADVGVTAIQVVDKNAADSDINPGTNYADARLMVPGTVLIPGMVEGTDYSVDYIKGTVTFLTPGAAASAAAVDGSGNNIGFDISFEWVRRSELDMDGVVNREVEESVSARINTTASEAFGSETEVSTWEAMINMLEGTLKNKPAKIQTALTQLDTAFNRQLAAQALNGARTLRMESTAERNDARVVTTAELQSKMEDVDFTEAISKFTLQQTVYEASLKMGAQAIQNTLMNFL